MEDVVAGQLLGQGGALGGDVVQAHHARVVEGRELVGGGAGEAGVHLGAQSGKRRCIVEKQRGGL